MTRKKRVKTYRPYKPVKMNFYNVPNPLADVPPDVRRQAVYDATQAARASFDERLPQLRRWFDETRYW